MDVLIVLSGTYEGYRNTDLHKGACLGCRIVLCENQSIYTDGFIEDLGLGYGILPCCGIDYQYLLVVLGLDSVPDDFVFGGQGERNP